MWRWRIENLRMLKIVGIHYDSGSTKFRELINNEINLEKSTIQLIVTHKVIYLQSEFDIDFTCIFKHIKCYVTPYDTILLDLRISN